MADAWDRGLRSQEPDDGDELFRREAEAHEPAARVRRWPVVAAALLAVAAIGAAYFVFFLATPDSGAPAAATAPAPPEAPRRPLGVTADPIALPPLDDTDPIVRKLVVELSSHPRIAAWLATDGLIRNFTTAVLNIADGSTPAPRLRVLKPPAAFSVRETGEDLEIDPRSYGRYDALADAVASIDAAGAARLYGMLKPRIEDAHRELGFPDVSFDRTLERAIASLLAVPVPADRVRVEPRGIGYRFEDADLEALTPAQKQLLRMGPRNVQIVQGQLRAIGLALGIPPDRLSR